MLRERTGCIPILLGLMVLAGCQLPGTPRSSLLPPATTSIPEAQANPGAQANPPATQPQEVPAGQGMTIRGQSGTGWNPAQQPNSTQPLPVIPPGSNFTPGMTKPQNGTLPSPASPYSPSDNYALPSTTVQQPAYPPSTTVQPSPGNGLPTYGYGSPTNPTAVLPPGQQPVGGYGATVAPGAFGGQAAVAPGSLGYTGEPFTGLDVPNITAPGGYQPRVRVSPVDVYLQEARTGRIILGGSVNSDLGVAGQLIIDEKNFDIMAFPRRCSDLWSGYAFRGAGQSFRAELMPGNQVERYTVNWATPNLFGYLPYSFSVGGFLFSRIYRDWTEQRTGGRLGLGYAITKDLSIGTEIIGENVKIRNPRVTGVAALDDVLGDNEMYTARFKIARDTRDSVFLATEGSLLELIYDQAFGDYDFPRGQINFSHYSRVHERPDGMGRHVLVNTWRVGFTGSETPIFENFFAGGFSSMRGFRFRGASPKENDVQVGGQFMFLGSLEYMFPLTADEMLRGVAFVDYGTVERDIRMTAENFRVAPGLGLRISVPMLGPAPLAFDFAVPVTKADGDEKQLLSFYMGFTR